MLNDSKLAIAILHEFFPIRARYLGRHLIESNKTVKVLEEWREQQLFKFIGLLSQNAEDLEQGYVENRITKVAWAARLRKRSNRYTRKDKAALILDLTARNRN